MGEGEGVKGGAELKFMNANFATDLSIFLLHVTIDNYSNITVDFNKMFKKVLLFSIT
jgi:hypothetical protein